MHQFLRAIGFSDITKKQLNEVINNIIDNVMWHQIWELQSEEYTMTMIALI